MKKFLSTALLFALIASLMPSSMVEASKKVKLNKTKLVLKEGKTYVLKLKNNKKKVKWSSSKKAVATVNAKGKVKAKKAGSAKITAKVKKKKYICKVTVQAKKSTPAMTNDPANTPGTVTSKPTNAPSSEEPTATPPGSPSKEEPTATPPGSPSDEEPTETPSNLTLIYDYAEQVPQDVPYIANYNTFKYDSFKMWLCPFTFYGEGAYATEDYRGKKLHYELTIQNSGLRDLPVLEVCMNFTSPKAYPTIFRVYDPSSGYGATPPDPEDYPYYDEEEERFIEYEEALEEYRQQKADAGLAQPIEKGETYTYSFDYTIPSNAVNQDTDLSGNRYPIMMYLANLKSYAPYMEGDEVTILGCKIYDTTN